MCWRNGPIHVRRSISLLHNTEARPQYDVPIPARF